MSGAIMDWAHACRQVGAASLDAIAQVAYDGTRYNGWQAQPSEAVRTVEAAVAHALSRITHGRVTSFMSISRTDADVSARCQLIRIRLPLDVVAHACAAQPADLLATLNAALPDDIRMVRCRYCYPSQIHLRQAVTSGSGKQYSYYVAVGTGRACADAVAHLREYAARVTFDVDVLAMQHALTAVVGTHDFRFLAHVQPRRPRAAAALGLPAAGELPSAAAAGSTHATRSMSASASAECMHTEHMRAVASPAVVASGTVAAIEMQQRAAEQSCHHEVAAGARASSVHSGDEPGSDDDAHGVVGDDDDDDDDDGVSVCGGDVDDTLSHASVRDGGSCETERAASSTVRRIDVAEITLYRAHDMRLSIHDPPPCDGLTLAAAGELGVPLHAFPGAHTGTDSARGAPAPDIGYTVLRFRFVGNGFLRYQIRRIMGVVLAIGKGKLPPYSMHDLVALGDALSHAEGEPRRLDASKLADDAALPSPLQMQHRYPAAPGRGLWQEAYFLPPHFWEDERYTNNRHADYRARFHLPPLPAHR
ncbi:hypothetical protein EON62_00385 [archaeon]|nr:MAG: hypothetical protein EON62_00385 [archaeon]